MSYKLYLDDFRNPIDTLNLIDSIKIDNNYSKEYQNDDDWTIVRNFDEFVKTIQAKGIPNVISFDHDLADEHYVPQQFWSSYSDSKRYQESKEKEYKEKTGLDAARWLINYSLLNNDYLQCVQNDLRFPTIFIHSQNPVGADKIEMLFHSFFKMYTQYSSFVKNVIEHTYLDFDRR